MKKKLKDWQERALKTFVQAFCGVLVPAIIGVLANAKTPSDIVVWCKTVAFSVICSALAAGISAIWNIVKEHRDNIPIEEKEGE